MRDFIFICSVALTALIVLYLVFGTLVPDGVQGIREAEGDAQAWCRARQVDGITHPDYTDGYSSTRRAKNSL